MLEMLKFRAEVWFYNRYASLNKKRKAKEGKSNLKNLWNKENNNINLWYKEKVH